MFLRGLPWLAGLCSFHGFGDELILVSSWGCGLQRNLGAYWLVSACLKVSVHHLPTPPPMCVCVYVYFCLSLSLCVCLCLSACLYGYRASQVGLEHTLPSASDDFGFLIPCFHLQKLESQARTTRPGKCSAGESTEDPLFVRQD